VVADEEDAEGVGGGASGVMRLGGCAIAGKGREDEGKEVEAAVAEEVEEAGEEEEEEDDDDDEEEGVDAVTLRQTPPPPLTSSSKSRSVSLTPLVEDEDEAGRMFSRPESRSIFVPFFSASSVA